MPSSGVMKPKPFVELNHFTVPFFGPEPSSAMVVPAGAASRAGDEVAGVRSAAGELQLAPRRGACERGGAKGAVTAAERVARGGW